jgi:hypothetical protein
MILPNASLAKSARQALTQICRQTIFGCFHHGRRSSCMQKNRMICNQLQIIRLFNLRQSFSQASPASYFRLVFSSKNDFFFSVDIFSLDRIDIELNALIFKKLQLADFLHCLLDRCLIEFFCNVLQLHGARTVRTGRNVNFNVFIS